MIISKGYIKVHKNWYLKPGDKYYNGKQFVLSRLAYHSNKIKAGNFKHVIYIREVK